MDRPLPIGWRVRAQDTKTGRADYYPEILRYGQPRQLGVYPTRRYARGIADWLRKSPHTECAVIPVFEQPCNG